MLDVGAYELVQCAASGPPGAVTGLTLAWDQESLAWPAVADATSYQVVRGDAGMLVASGGNFESSSLICLDAGQPVPEAADGTTPAAGQAFYYVARAVTCAGAGTYDGASNPANSRDAGINAAPSTCP